MKKTILSLMTASLLLLSCDKNENNDAEKGTLTFLTTVWNTKLSDDVTKTLLKAKGDTNTVDLINIRHLISKIEITTDEIKDGVSPNDINWTLMYESNQEMLHTDREVTIELPVGEYKGIKLTQRNLMYWVCLFEGDTIEFPSLNNSDLQQNAELFNYFGEEGFYEIEDGVFVSTNAEERLGFFEIKPDATTKVTMRMNLITLDWVDSDGSGEWSYGDELTNWTVPEGVTTMTDFIVEYE